MTAFRAAPLPFDGELPQEEFMLICNASTKQQDALLAAMREAGLVPPREPLLAPWHNLVNAVNLARLKRRLKSLGG